MVARAQLQIGKLQPDAGILEEVDLIASSAVRSSTRKD